MEFNAAQNFELAIPDSKNNILAGEYFIDDDPEYGNGLPIDIAIQDSIVLQDFNVATAGLTEGFHKLYGRFRDSVGNWSHTFRRNLEVSHDQEKNVVNGEYFFRIDNDFGNCNPVTFIPSPDISSSFTIPAANIPPGADTLFIRVRNDVDNKWSITQWNDSLLTVVPLTLLNFSAVKRLHNAELSWQTTNEINLSHFNIQRRTNGTDFSTVARTAAKGNASTRSNYAAFDNSGI